MFAFPSPLYNEACSSQEGSERFLWEAWVHNTLRVFGSGRGLDRPSRATLARLHSKDGSLPDAAIR